MKMILLLSALGAGMLVPIQAVLNTKMGRALGDSVFAALISFSVGTVSLFVYALVVRIDLGSIRQASGLPWMVWAAGCLGAVFVAATIILTPRLGAALTFSLVVAGQLLMSVIMDHFGALGIQIQPMSWMRLVGIALITAGVVLIQKF